MEDEKYFSGRIPKYSCILSVDWVAIKQIEEKGYLDRYQLDPREKIAIGITISSKDKKVVAHEMRSIR